MTACVTESEPCVIDCISRMRSALVNWGFLSPREKTTGYLLCDPEYFGVEYEINPHMEGNIDQVGRNTARRQWERLRSMLSRFCHVEVMAGASGLPDMPFIANAGLTFSRHERKRCIMSRFKHAQREGEVVHYESFLGGKGYEISHLRGDVDFEGEGDALWMPGAELLFGGYGWRTDPAAYIQVSKIYQVPVITLELVDARFYHLDTCFCPLNAWSVLYYPGAFAPKSQRLIEATFPHRFEVSAMEAARFVCNTVVVGAHVIMPHGVRRIERALRDRGFGVHTVDMSEFKKAGGAAKCLTLSHHA